MTIGSYEELDSKTKITFVTYIPINFVLLFGGGLLLVAFIFNYLSITADVPLIVFFLFNGFYIFFGLRLYWSLKGSVKNLAEDIEREIGFWLAKANALQQKL